MDTVKSVYVFTQNYMFDSETHAARACLHYIFGEMGYFQGFFKDGGGTISSICPNRSRWYSTDPWK